MVQLQLLIKNFIKHIVHTQNHGLKLLTYG